MQNSFAICHCRSCPPEVFLGKSFEKICSKFTEEHSCWIVISIKLSCNVCFWQHLILLLPYNFIEITFRHECSPVNWLHFFRTPFLKNSTGGLLLFLVCDRLLPIKIFFRGCLSILLLPSKARILNCVKATWCLLSTTPTYQLNI